MLVHKTSGRRITESQYNNLPYYEKVDYIPETNSSNRSNGDFLTSAILGAVTDSALIGGLLGGDIVGGMVGDMLDGDLMD